MNLGEQVTLWTIRAALLGYGAVLCGKVYCGAANHVLSRQWSKRLRVVWTIGCVLFLVHLAAALHYYHHDSHAVAVAHTTEQTERVVGVRFNGGIYFNYLFALVWLGDVFWWWRAEQRFLTRPRWQAWLIEGYLFFIAFNSTVVFASGPIRWLAATFCVLLVVVAISSRRSLMSNGAAR